MLTIDTHLHTSNNRYEPIEVCLFQMNRCDVDKATLLVSRSISDLSRGTHDNAYCIESMRRFPGRFSVICCVDTSQPDALEKLSHWAKEGAEGVRLYVSERSPGKDPLAIWKRANELKLVVSCPGTTLETGGPEFRKIIETFPDMPIIVEHLGVMKELLKVSWWSNPEPPYTDFKKVLALSKYPNVYMKLTGLGEYMRMSVPYHVPVFQMKDVPPFMDMAIEAFGPRRLMIGSDFPPVSSREGYANVWNFLREYLKRLSRRDQAAIFGETAASLFAFGQKK